MMSRLVRYHHHHHLRGVVRCREGFLSWESQFRPFHCQREARTRIETFRSTSSRFCCPSTCRGIFDDGRCHAAPPNEYHQQQQQHRSLATASLTNKISSHHNGVEIWLRNAFIYPTFDRRLHLKHHQQLGYRFHSTHSTIKGGSSSLASPISRRQPRPTDLEYAVSVVREHDPAGYGTGQFLPERRMQMAYYAVRGFWIETGLRVHSTARVPANATPAQHLAWWQEGIQAVFASIQKNDLAGTINLASARRIESSTSATALDSEASTDFLLHPILRLLHDFMVCNPDVPWKQETFDDLLQGRRLNLQIQQYQTVEELVNHALHSCGSLFELVLESGEVFRETHPVAFEAARYLGICHGLTQALRTSIPVMSTTGRLIIPVELTQKYGIRSPRYLLSALALGDESCQIAMAHVVEDLVQEARHALHQARARRSALLQEPHGRRAAAVMLPGLFSEAFLDRLQAVQYRLTDRTLRQVGWGEQAVAWLRMVSAYYQQTY